MIVPVFNEEARLPRAIPTLQRLVRAGTEVLVVDDGSTDGTAKLLGSLDPHPLLHVIDLSRNRGKGAAVREGVLASRGDVVTFMDADLATDPAGLEPLWHALTYADVAIGSRSHAGSRLRDTTERRSRMGGKFNRLVRGLTGLDVSDTQCGFKAFRAPVAKLLFATTRVDGFAFDVEVLCLARRHGLRVVEVPVVWTEVPGTKVRLVRDPLRMTFDVVRTRVLGPARTALPCSEVASTSWRGEDLAAALRGRMPNRLVVTNGDRVVFPCPGNPHDACDPGLDHARDLAPDLVVSRREIAVGELLRLTDSGTSTQVHHSGANEHHRGLAIAPSGLD